MIRQIISFLLICFLVVSYELIDIGRQRTESEDVELTVNNQ
ncbi:MAG: hypothetical protein ACTTJ6_08275 [Treponema sp.]